MSKRVIALFMIFILFSGPAFAKLADYQNSAWTYRETYVDKVIGKMGFSGKNVLMGWSEAFYHTYTAANKGENIIEGAVVGAWYGAADTIGGLIQLLTFPFTNFDFKLPEGGTHMFKPII